MCRIFGLRSRASRSVRHALVDAENALGVQSRAHPDGWGLGFYEGDAPRVIKGTNPAWADESFTRLSQDLCCQAVIAHVRKATVGGLCLTNTHPFAWGRWLFAHNGDVRGFHLLRPYFVEEIADHLRDGLQGSTDSEHCFYLFLTELDRLDALHRPHAGAVAEALAETVRRIALWAEILQTEPPILNLLVTDGELLAVTRVGRKVFFSTDRCQPGAQRPEAVPTGELGWLRISSEPTSGEEAWTEVPENAVLLVDREMYLRVTAGILPERLVRAKATEEHVPAPSPSAPT